MKILEECGCDTSASKENIEKALNLLSKQAVHLAKSACNIKIDDEEFNMATVQKEKFLHEVKPKLLNSATNNEKDDKNE